MFIMSSHTMMNYINYIILQKRFFCPHFSPKYFYLFVDKYIAEHKMTKS